MSAATLWYPCEHPERPNDGSIVWHSKCRGCHVAAVATVRRWPDDPIVQSLGRRIERMTQPDDDDDEAWL